MILLTLNQFPIHLAYTNNKKTVNKYAKLNYQSIYNGKINRFARATLMDNLHKYIEFEILSQKVKKIKLTYPIKLHFEIHTVINHGDISLRKGVLNWKKPDKDYKATWDIENLASIWIKGFNDALTISKTIPDDNVQYIKSISYEFIPVEELTDRKIVVRYE